MHPYSELIYDSTAANLAALRESSDRIIEMLQTSGATNLVKALQRIQLQKAVLAVGMFSMFEAILQDGLTCKDGFRDAGEILENDGETDLKESFGDMQMAINVLKHGKGRSYDALVEKAANLPFRVKMPNEAFFSEGDAMEVSTLIEVDDQFVLLCAELIRDVSIAITRSRPDFIS